ncbi:PKD domain containing protein [Methanoregula boonei 6A8]|uniref:PKD domain containing protein n=2 Tax=Methanoregula TaxID=395331 RepID=A7I524_METB6|nr:PKD domain containing protein [Methanoregula boonei 6A8]
MDPAACWGHWSYVMHPDTILTRRCGKIIRGIFIVVLITSLLFFSPAVAGDPKLTIVLTARIVPVSSAWFATNVTEGPALLPVAFTDQSTDMPVSWKWDFGDGAVDTVRNPVHIFETPGIYTVLLTVGTMSGNSSRAAQIIDVGAPPDALGSNTLRTSAIGPGTTTTLDFSAQAGTSIDITTNNSVQAGTPVTVTEYSSPPFPEMSLPAFTAAGRYIAISAQGLEANVSSVTITMQEPAPLPAGVTEANLVIEFFDPATDTWTVLPCTLDTTSHTISTTSTHLSAYGLFASPVTAAPGSGSSSGASEGGFLSGGSSSGGSGSVGLLQFFQLAPVRAPLTPAGIHVNTPAVVPVSAQKAPVQTPAAGTSAQTSPGLPLMGIAVVVAVLAITGVALLAFARRNT